MIGTEALSSRRGTFWFIQGNNKVLIFPPAAAGAWVGGQVYSMDSNLVWQITSVALLVSAGLVLLFVHEPERVQR